MEAKRSELMWRTMAREGPPHCLCNSKKMYREKTNPRSFAQIPSRPGTPRHAGPAYNQAPTRPSSHTWKGDFAPLLLEFIIDGLL